MTRSKLCLNTIDFKGYERQFDQLEVSLDNDKGDKHLTVYNSYNAICPAKMIKNVEVANISGAYSATNTMKFDTSNDAQKHMLWKQYVAWHCDGYSAAPISDYVDNPAFQELLLKSNCFGNKSDGKVYIDQRDSLGFTNEFEKLSRNNSKLLVMIELENALALKVRL